MIEKNAVVAPIRLRSAALTGVVLLAGMAIAGCQPDNVGAAPSGSSTPTTTPSSMPTASTPATSAGVPDQAAIQAVMARTVEVANPHTHFVSRVKPVTTSDRQGGTLTAVIGQRSPSADGNGQLVFFWHGTKFIGWDAETETNSVRNITGGGGYFKVTYTHYAPRDPACCASLPPVTVGYILQDNEGLVPSGQRPHHGNPVQVKLTS